MSIIKLNPGYRLLVKHRLLALTLARKFDISHWFPCGAEGRADVWSRRITKISRVANFFRYGGRVKFHAVMRKLRLGED